MDEQKVVKGRRLLFRKKVKKYIFEFVMLFLAISLGFFVENFRSSLSDRELEIQNIESLLVDLRQDSILFQSQVEETKLIASMCDSVIQLLNKPNRTPEENRKLYFINRRITPKLFPFHLNQRTFDEMKSSGTLRLIHSRKIADGISKYYFLSKELDFINNLIVDRAHKKLELEIRIFDTNVAEQMLDKTAFKFSLPTTNPQLVIQDRISLNEYEGILHYISAVSVYGRKKIEDLNIQAKLLISILKKEYQVD